MNYPLVGLFVLILGAALVAVVLWLAAGGAWQKKYDTYLAIEDESVAGLNLNAPVKYNGVEVGKVSYIRLNPTNPEKVELLLAIERGTPIKQDTVAMLKGQGLTGIVYVELDGGAAGAPALTVLPGAEYAIIKTKPSLSARVENVLTKVMNNLDRTTANINSLLSDDNRAAFASALADISGVARTVAARKAAIDSGIANAARTFENTSRLSAQAGPVLDRMGQGADAVNKMGAEVAGTGASATRLLDTVAPDIKRFTSETMPELERLMGELTALGGSLRRISEQTERDPRGLIFGRNPASLGPGERAAAPPSPGSPKP